MSIFILFVVLQSYGLILNETTVNPPLSVYDHMAAVFGIHPDDTDISFSPLVLVKPEFGCWNIENEEELQGAIVLTLKGNCSYFDKAWNIASLGGSGIIVGNNIENDSTLIKMQKSANEYRDVDITCVFVTKATYDAALAAINGGTVFASLAEGHSVVMYFPDMVRIVTYLIVIFPLMWLILTIIHCCHKDMKARWERQKRNRQHKRIPEILFTKDLLRIGSQHEEIHIESTNNCFIINDNCAICLEDFVESVKVKLLACGHGFHPKCIAPWISERSDTCPVCRETVTDKFNDNETKSSHCFTGNFSRSGSGTGDVEIP